MDRNYHPTRPRRNWVAPHNSDDSGYATIRARRPNIAITSPSPVPSSIPSHSGDDRDFTTSPSPCPSSEHGNSIDGNRVYAYLRCPTMDPSIQQDIYTVADTAAFSNFLPSGTADHLLWPNDRLWAQHMNPSRHLLPVDARRTGQGTSSIIVTETSDTHPSIHVQLSQGRPAFRTEHSEPLIYPADDLAPQSPVSNGLPVSPRSYAPPSPYQNWQNYSSLPSGTYMTGPYLEQPTNSGMHQINTGPNYDGRGNPLLRFLSQDQNIFEPRPVGGQVDFHLESTFLKCLNDYVAHRYPASPQKPEFFVDLGDIRADINTAVLDKCPALGHGSDRYRAQIDTIFARFKRKVGTKAIREDRDKKKQNDQTHWCPFIDCGGVFTRSNGLKNHLAAHFDLKETVCKTCNKALRLASSARHMATCGKGKG